MSKIQLYLALQYYMYFVLIIQMRIVLKRTFVGHI